MQLKGPRAGLCAKNRTINENPRGAMGLTNVPRRRIFQLRQRLVNSVEPFLAISDIRVLHKVFEATDDFAMAVTRIKPDRQIVIGRKIVGIDVHGLFEASDRFVQSAKPSECRAQAVEQDSGVRRHLNAPAKQSRRAFQIPSVLTIVPARRQNTRVARSPLQCQPIEMLRVKQLLAVLVPQSLMKGIAGGKPSGNVVEECGECQSLVG